MSIDGTVICPHCGEASQVARKYAGRRARCHRCAKSFPITFLRPGEEPPAAVTAPPSAGGRSRGRTGWLLATLMLLTLASVTIGIMLTRPDTSPPGASASVVAPAPGASPTASTTTAVPASGPADSTAAFADPTIAPRRGTPGLDALGLTPFGESARRGRVSLRVTNARIARPELRTADGSVHLADDPALLITVELTSTDPGEAVRLQPAPGGLAATLEDDFGNLLRSPALPSGTRLAIALSPDTAIPHGEPITTGFAFETPPPLSDHLVLSLDLAALGEAGRVRFRIPRSRITG